MSVPNWSIPQLAVEPSAIRSVGVAAMSEADEKAKFKYGFFGDDRTSARKSSGIKREDAKRNVNDIREAGSESQVSRSG